jgi:MFS family permease
MTDIPEKAAKTVDLVQLMNQLEIGRFHLQLLGLCAAVVFMDGFDAQAIGYVAPSLSQAWGLAPGTLGPVFGAGLFGIMLGALVGGAVRRLCRSEASHSLDKKASLLPCLFLLVGFRSA